MNRKRIDTTTLIKRISSNYIRAQQLEKEPDNRREIRHLLFAAQDIISLLKLLNEGEVDNITISARTYAESLYYSTERIRELVASNEIKTTD